MGRYLTGVARVLFPRETRIASLAERQLPYSARSTSERRELSWRMAGPVIPALRGPGHRHRKHLGY
jgi:hypothetical protein